MGKMIIYENIRIWGEGESRLDIVTECSVACVYDDVVDIQLYFVLLEVLGLVCCGPDLSFVLAMLC